MKIELNPGDKLEITLKDSDGIVTVHFDDDNKRFYVHADIADPQGREGIVYCEEWKDDPWRNYELAPEEEIIVTDGSTFDIVQHIVARHLGVEDKRVTPEAHILDTLGGDSLDVVELTMALEAEFDIEISDDEIDSEGNLNIANIVKLIDTKVTENSKQADD